MSVFKSFKNGDLLDIKNDNTPLTLGLNVSSDYELSLQKSTQAIEFALIFSHSIIVSLDVIPNGDGKCKSFFQSQSRLIPTFIQAIDNATIEDSIGDYIADVLYRSLNSLDAGNRSTFGGVIKVNDNVVSTIKDSNDFGVYLVSDQIDKAIEALKGHK